MKKTSEIKLIDLAGLKKEFGEVNIHSLPRLKSVVVNVGVSSDMEKEDRDKIAEVIGLATGQKPVKTQAKKSVAAFKVRQGATVGYKVTLHGDKMRYFLAKLINVVLPRTRDFRGVKLSGVTAGGCLNIGIRDVAVFPEIKPESLKGERGLQITVVSTAKNKTDGEKFWRAIGFPLEK